MNWKPFLLTLCTALVAGVWTACFDSCQPPFAPGNHIDKFRIIAIQAEPPEIAPGDTTRVTFLAVEPNGLVTGSQTFPPSQCFTSDGLADPSAVWLACLPGIGAKQQNDSSCTSFPQLGGGASDAGTPGFPDAGAGGPSFQILFPPCGSVAAWTSPKGYLSTLPAEDQLKGAEAIVVLATLREKQNQISLKRIRISTKPKESRNTNPRISGIFINDTPITSCRPETPTDCKVHNYAADETLTFRAAIEAQSQDPLPATENKKAQREDITLEWFATNGEFDTRRNVFSGEDPPNHSPLPKWFANDFRGKALDVGTEIQIVVVARDLRGGIDWLSSRIKLDPPKSRD